MKYRGRLCFVSPSRRSSLLKAMVALAAFLTERHSMHDPSVFFFSPFEEVSKFLTSNPFQFGGLARHVCRHPDSAFVALI